MVRKLPPVHWLRAFEAAARHVSFTAAGRELGVTQSAVSQQVRLLEEHLGQPLFRRLPRGLEITAAGRAYLTTVQAAFERLAAGTQELFGTMAAPALTLRTTPGFAQFWLAGRLARFRDRHPRLPLRLISAIWPSEFAGETADLEVRYGRGDWPGLSIVRLTRETRFPVAAPEVADRLRAPADLAGETLLHAVGFDKGWPQWLAAAGVAQVAETAPTIVTDTTVVSMELARQGAGVALAHASLAREWIARGRLAAPFPMKLKTDEAFFLVHPVGRELSPQAAACRDWLIEEAAAGMARPSLRPSR